MTRTQTALALLREAMAADAKVGIRFTRTNFRAFFEDDRKADPEAVEQAWRYYVEEVQGPDLGHIENQFGQIMSLAHKVFGTLEETEQWLLRPAMGLNRQRPIDLLRTDEGTQLVEDHLGRIEHGVYT